MKTKLNSCPNQDHFLRAISNESSEMEKAELIAHVSDCPRCWVKLKSINLLRREFDAAAQKLNGAELSPREIRAFRKMAHRRLREEKTGHEKKSASKIFPFAVRRFALAAGLLLVLLIGYGAIRYFFRDNLNRGVSGDSFQLVAPLGQIDQAPSKFSWLPVKNGDLYKFKLIDENLRIIHSNETPQTSFILDSSVRSRLERGTVYLWTVEVISDSEEKLAFREGTFIIR